MSIEELVDQELANGGMVKPQEPEPEVDEDDMNAADKETYKKREWDLFTEANPRGSDLPRKEGAYNTEHSTLNTEHCPDLTNNGHLTTQP
ncbi:unnamed protein product [Ambrosiozyma monospora]|uniref:Unnamed protein product n=1 Tax=Ambrosiozyma monospora TaxID=43982 RepID=A0ACB5U1C0_AMBMO|nr:unnamed protein product [Ambrosiozyma monospora]